MIFSPGELVGGYEILGLLGAGGMSEVFEARDPLLGRVVALKAARQAAAGALRKEAQALAAVRHPSVVTVHAMGVHRDVEFLVMERLNGSSLEQLIDRRATAFPVAEAVDLLTRITEGLVALHDAGIAHCDLKPANVMLSGARLILMDLGIVRAEFERPRGHVTGTPHYMAPELIRDALRPGLWHLVDLYALGVIGYELLAGAPPFDSDNLAVLLDGHVHGEVPPLAALCPDAPPPLVRLIHQLLGKQPQDRGDGAEAVLWQLQAIARDLARPPLNVLVVDDDRDVVELLRAAVRRAVHDAVVVSAADSSSALEQLRRQPPDLLLLDVNLPGMSGVELCMYLRGAGLAERCPIIVVSACVDDGDVRLLARLGVRRFVRKGSGIADRLGVALRGVVPAAYR